MPIKTQSGSSLANATPAIQLLGALRGQALEQALHLEYWINECQLAHNIN